MIRMNRNVGVALVVAAVAAAGIGVAVKAAEDHTTTFTFNYKGVKINAGTKNFSNATMTGTTNVPNVGPVTLTGRFTDSEGVSGSGTLTVKNTPADKIFFTWHNGEIDSTGEFELTMTLTGGTGLYENCEGTGLVEGLVIVKNKKVTIDFLAGGHQLLGVCRFWHRLVQRDTETIEFDPTSGGRVHTFAAVGFFLPRNRHSCEFESAPLCS